MSLIKGGRAAVADLYLDLTKKDDLERAAYIATSVAFADGELEAKEREMLPKLLQQMFRNFNPGEVAAVVSRAIEDHSISPEMGFLATEERLKGVESPEEVRKLFAVAKALAGADGDLERSELDVIQRFATFLGYDLEQLGIEGARFTG